MLSHQRGLGEHINSHAVNRQNNLFEQVLSFWQLTGVFIFPSEISCIDSNYWLDYLVRLGCSQLYLFITLFMTSTLSDRDAAEFGLKSFELPDLHLI